jgi:di/tricarboxylate transporter
LERLAREQQLQPQDRSDQNPLQWLWEMGGSSVLVHPESSLIGKSLKDVMFRSHYHLHVLGLRRDGKPLLEFEDTKLASADNLLVIGPWSELQQLQARHHDFVVLETPSEQAEVVPAYRRMPVALLILSVMVLLSIFNVVPLVAAVLMAVLAAVFSGCLTMEDAYRSIHWSSLVLVAGMLPLADALEKTGGTDIIVNALMTTVGDAGPNFMMSVIFFLTAALGLFLSNTASAVLVAPIAIVVAEALGVSPYPFAIAVLIAASAAFVTPVSTPVVTLVVEPGRYAFTDFVKVGLPLLILTWATTLLVAPIFFPYSP